MSEEIASEVADAVQRHEAQWGPIQEGDTVQDRAGGIWQLRGRAFVHVRPPRLSPDPNGAHALST